MYISVKRLNCISLRENPIYSFTSGFANTETKNSGQHQ